jgi:6-pyruvoyltetrahydropterin/6-carboxytetrahydropterin synthase
MRSVALFEVTVDDWFAAAHQLRLLDGSLEPLHGHNWRVRVTCRGERLDGMGVLLDFTRLRPALREILQAMHDRNLNDLPAFGARNPSAEHVAMHIAERIAAIPELSSLLWCIEVEEAPGCTARYYPR